jgi:hypothetical protein
LHVATFFDDVKFSFYLIKYKIIVNNKIHKKVCK